MISPTGWLVDTSALRPHVPAFVRTGRPGRERLGVTARGDDVQHLWLDHPTSPYIWPIPGSV